MITVTFPLPQRGMLGLLLVISNMSFAPCPCSSIYTFFSSPNALFYDYLSYASHQTLTTVTPSINTSALPEKDGSPFGVTKAHSLQVSITFTTLQLTYCLLISNSNSNRRKFKVRCRAYWHTARPTRVCSRLVLFTLARRITGSTMTRNVN